MKFFYSGVKRNGLGHIDVIGLDSGFFIIDEKGKEPFILTDKQMHEVCKQADKLQALESRL